MRVKGASRASSLVFRSVIAVVLLGIGELVLRILAPGWMFCFRTRACPQPYRAWFITQRGPNFSLETGEPLFVFDPRLLWRPRPNVRGTFWGTEGVQTNSLGLRDGPVDPAKGRGVVVVGNSAVWGAGVRREERFTDRASRLLARESGYQDVQVINAGVPGYSSFQVLQFLTHVAIPEFKPTVVVICVGVDDAWLVYETDKEQFKRNTAIVPTIRRVLRKSDLFLFLNRYLVESVVWAGTGHNLRGFSLFYGDQPGAGRAVRVSPVDALANLREAGELVVEAGGRVVALLQDPSDDRPPFWVRDSFQEGRDRCAELARQRGWAVIDMRVLRRPPLQMSVEECLEGFSNPTPEAHAVLGYMVAETLKPMLAN